MKNRTEQLEGLVERELQVLSELRTPAPRPEILARVKNAVRSEVGGLNRSRAGLYMLPRWAAVAAAVVLAVGLSGVFEGSIKSGEQPADAAELLAVWTDAVGKSSDQITFLLADGWIVEDAAGENGEPMDRLLESLDASLEQLGTF